MKRDGRNRESPNAGRLVLLTGERGVGKSTVCARLAGLWRECGGAPAGLLTRTDGPRRFLVDIATGEGRLLAAEGEELAGPRWGRYSFSQEALDWGNEALRRAAQGPADLLLLDEAGPLELVVGEGLRPGLFFLLQGKGPGLVVVRPALVEQVRGRAAGRAVRVAVVTVENREGIAGEIIRQLKAEGLGPGEQGLGIGL